MNALSHRVPNNTSRYVCRLELTNVAPVKLDVECGARYHLMGPNKLVALRRMAQGACNDPRCSGWKSPQTASGSKGQCAARTETNYTTRSTSMWGKRFVHM